MKAKLEEARQKLEEDLSGLSVHTEMGDDLGENAEEVEVDEVNRDLIARIKGDLAKIEKALSKIENGTYGTDDAGKEISPERLQAIPWADKAL